MSRAVAMLSVREKTRKPRPRRRRRPRSGRFGSSGSTNRATSGDDSTVLGIDTDPHLLPDEQLGVAVGPDADVLRPDTNQVLGVRAEVGHPLDHRPEHVGAAQRLLTADRPAAGL